MRGEISFVLKNQKRPLVFMDIESNGLSTTNDRIIEISLIKMELNGVEKSFSSFINPETFIPEPSFRIHHIANDMVKNAPTFKEIGPQIRDFIGTADLGGYGIIKFDIPILQAEFDRAGIPFFMDGRNVIDALIIFRRMERRNLSAAYQFYCGKSLEGAHRAEEDVRAAWEVFWAQVKRYDNLSKDPNELDKFCREFKNHSEN